ncbi:hypothetical protein [Paludisphaera rhizosphaerae]|uniref:hypothetical protein n=1 Tax=Paludisphaera rhizosphaerae TaxID=2711216 RepID=UPI0013E9B127|nr:hypothetical protein [Paludisphaera rhizosphaerae]
MSAVTSYRNAAARSWRAAVDSVSSKCIYVSITSRVEPGEDGLAVATIRLRDPRHLSPEEAVVRVEVDLAEAKATMISTLAQAVARLRGRDQDASR